MKLGNGLGIIVGIIALAVLGCDPGVAPLIATTMEATTKVAQDSVTVGTRAPEAPTVRVLDQDDNPIANVVVTFAVTAGAGTIQRASDSTDENGIASVDRWTLGTTAGQNAVRATAGVPADAQPVDPVVFTAIGRSGPPVSMLITAGNNQTTGTGLQVNVRPGVRLSDQFGNPTGNVSVLFQPIAGSGTVVGGSQTTGANGVASVGGWTMGVIAGPNKLNATVSGLGFVQFTATATDSPQCFVHAPYTLVAVLSGALQAGDCLQGSNRLIDLFDVVNPLTQALRFDQQSTAFAPALHLFDVLGNTLAEDLVTNGTGAGATASTVTIITPAATIVVGASSFAAQKLGAYQLTSSVVSGLVENCNLVFVRPGIATNQNLVNTDCADTTGPFYFDRFYVSLIAGVPVTVRMNSTVFDTYLELQNGAFDSMVSNDDQASGNTNSRVTFTPQVSGYFVIVASSKLASAVGAYTLTIDPP